MLDLPASAMPFAVAWTLFLGAAVGSFLNVVVARVPAGLSVVHPRSRCPSCLAPIAWFDNLPVVSWLALRARCRACRTPISARYPLVEVAGAAAAGLALWRHGPGAAAAAELALVALLLALALIDLDTWLLPHGLTWPLLGAGLLLAPTGLTAAGSWQSAFAGAGVGFAVFAAISLGAERLYGREAMGFGDVWLLAGLGAWLGLAALLPVILLASLQGTAVGLALAAAGKLPRGREVREGEAPGDLAGPPPPPPAADGPGAGAEPSARAALPPGGEAGPEPTVDPAPAAAAADEEEWVPPRNAVPFGPFLVAGALEWLYLGAMLARAWPTLQVFR